MNVTWCKDNLTLRPLLGFGTSGGCCLVSILAHRSSIRSLTWDAASGSNSKHPLSQLAVRFVVATGSAQVCIWSCGTIPQIFRGSLVSCRLNWRDDGLTFGLGFVCRKCSSSVILPSAGSTGGSGSSKDAVSVGSQGGTQVNRSALPMVFRGSCLELGSSEYPQGCG